jgi:hypothetical protein
MSHKVTYHHIMEGVWGVEKYNPLPSNVVSFSRKGGQKIDMRKLCVKPTKAQKRKAFALLISQQKGNV